MNAVARAIAAAAKAQQRLAGVCIVYRRGEDEVPLKATPGRTTYQTTDAEGREVQAQARDYLIIAGDLLIDGEPIEPREGDTIVEELTDGEHTFELMPLPNEPCWRWSDEQHIRRRVHTKETDQP